MMAVIIGVLGKGEEEHIQLSVVPRVGEELCLKRSALFPGRDTIVRVDKVLYFIDASENGGDALESVSIRCTLIS